MAFALRKSCIVLTLSRPTPSTSPTTNPNKTPVTQNPSLLGPKEWYPHRSARTNSLLARSRIAEIYSSERRRSGPKTRVARRANGKYRSSRRVTPEDEAWAEAETPEFFTKEEKRRGIARARAEQAEREREEKRKETQKSRENVHFEDEHDSEQREQMSGEKLLPAPRGPGTCSATTRSPTSRIDAVELTKPELCMIGKHYEIEKGGYEEQVSR